MAQTETEFSLISLFAGILFGGGGTALIEYLITKPKPRVQPMGVNLESLVSADVQAIEDDIRNKKSKDVFQFPKEAFDTFWGNRYLERLPALFRHPNDYISFLYNQKTNISVLKTRHAIMPRVLQEMRLNIHANLVKEALDKWAQYHEVIWPELITAFNLHEFDIVLSDEDIEDRRLNKKCDVFQDRDMNWCVSIGSFNLTFESASYPNVEAVKAFSRSVVHVIACHDTEILDNILRFLEENTDWKSTSFDDVDATISKQMKDFSRIVVRGVLTNSGRTSVSLSGSPILVFDSKGYYFENTENGKTELVPSDIIMQCDV